jgi:hypothetical protein
MLCSPHLVGDRTYKDQVVAAGIWEPILGPLTSAMVRNLLAVSVGGKRRQPQAPLLTGRLRCGLCQRVLTSTGNRYLCKPPRGCGRVSIIKNDLDRWVTTQLLWRLRRRVSGRQTDSAVDRTGGAASALDAHPWIGGDVADIPGVVAMLGDNPERCLVVGEPVADRVAPPLPVFRPVGWSSAWVGGTTPNANAAFTGGLRR